jgi:hypothetical protein
MKETLIPCTQGLANAGVPFGLDLPHGRTSKTPQNNLKIWQFFTLLVFNV